MILDFIVRTRSDGSAGAEAAASLNKVEGAAKSAGQSAGAAGREIKGAGKEIKELGRLGHEAEGVLMGLERGGISGMAIAAKNLAGIVKALATGSIGAVLLPVLAAAATGFIIMGKEAERNGKAIEKIYKDLEKSSKEYEARIKQLTKTTNEMFQEQKNLLAQLKMFWSELAKNDAETEKRHDVMTKANRELQDSELELAKTKALQAAVGPEAKAKVEQEFELKKKQVVEDRKALDLKHEGIEADTKAARASGELSDAKAQKAALEKKFGAIKSDRDSAVQLSEAALKGATTEAGAEAARKAGVEAKAQDEIYKKAKLEFEQSLREISQVIAEAERKVKDAQLGKDETAVKKKTLSTQEQQRLVELAGPGDAEGNYKKAGASVEEIQAAIKAEEDRAVTSHKFGDVGNTEGLKTQLAAAQKSEAEAYRIFVEDAKARKKEADNIKQVMKNTREGGS